MSSEWTVKRLGDYCLKIGSGSTPRGGKEAYLEFGPYKLIRSQNIYNDGFSPGGLAFIDESQAKKLDGVAVEFNDVLLNITGDSVARVCQAPANHLPARVNQHVAIIRPNPTIIDPTYLRYFLATPAQQNLMLGLASAGATRNALTKSMIEGFCVPCPPIEIQQNIAGLLSSIDDRINLQRETNRTLESIAQAIFKSWFVDFDPVHAKAKGIAPEGMGEATAALFPDSFEETELGMVPRGWTTENIEDICSAVTNGGTPSRSTKSFWESGVIPWYKTGDFSDGFLLEPSEKITELALKSSSAKLLPENSVLMAIYAAPTVGRLGILTRPSTFNQACTGMVAKSQIGPWFLYWTLYFGRDWFNSRANGAAQQNISKAIVAAYKFTCPSTQVLAAFNDICGALHKSIRVNVEHIATLASLRDTLLPRLISGQLRIEEAQEIVESA
jgi:type I restriction enzyme S subunit